MFALGNDNRKSEILSAIPSKLKVLSQWPRRNSSGLHIAADKLTNTILILVFLQFCNYFLPHRVLFQLIPTILSGGKGAMSEQQMQALTIQTHIYGSSLHRLHSYSAFELPLHMLFVCTALLLLCLLLSTEELFPFSLLIVCVLIKLASQSSGRKS